MLPCSSVVAGRDSAGRRNAAAGVFNRAAATYERVGPAFFSHYGQRLVDLVRPQPGSKVLDVATGTGAVLLSAANRVGPTGTVIGVDLAEVMIERLRQEIARRGLTNAKAEAMDAQELAFPDASFGYALCAFALHLFPDPDGALDELHRVLRPGGGLGLTLSSKWWWQGDDRWAWHGDLLRSLGAPIHPKPPRFTTPQEVEADLKAHRFKDISVVEDAFPLVFGDFEEWWNWGWSHGYRRILESMGRKELGRYRETCARELAAQGTARGIEGRLEVLLATAHSARDDAKRRDPGRLRARARNASWG